MDYSILFTAGGSHGQEAVYKHLHNKYKLFFTDMDIKKISPNIPEENKFLSEKVNNHNYIFELAEFCLKNNIDLIVPGIDEELIPILENKRLFTNTKIFLPNYDFVKIMLDKFLMAKKLSDFGIVTPRFERGDTFTNKLNFPLILKPRKGRGSSDVYEIIEKNKLDSFFKLYVKNKKDWIVQEKIEGQEYTVQVFSNIDSSLISIIPIKVQEKKGSTLFAETDYDKNIIDYCKKIHHVFQPNGTYNIQLFKGKDKSISCFEINPRISTTFCIGIFLGIDPFKSFLKQDDLEKKFLTSKNVRLKRHIHNYINTID